MTQTQTLKTLRRAQWRSLERHIKRAYQAGFDAGVARARGGSRRGRTIRGDATIDGLLRRIERHFGLERYGFEVRVVHRVSGRRLSAKDLLSNHLSPNGD
jgi:hypothetical protein